MAKLSRVSIVVSVGGDGVSESQTLPTLVNADAPAAGPLAYALVSGDNTIPVPPGTLGMIVLPPASSTVTKVLKGAAPDTGFAISANQTSVLSLPIGQTSIILNLSGGETIQIHWL